MNIKSLVASRIFLFQGIEAEQQQNDGPIIFKRNASAAEIRDYVFWLLIVIMRLHSDYLGHIDARQVLDQLWDLRHDIQHLFDKKIKMFG